jgi:hypothetical protein
VIETKLFCLHLALHTVVLFATWHVQVAFAENKAKKLQLGWNGEGLK